MATGAIGNVTIKNSVAYRNGYILVKKGGNKKNFEFADGAVDESGNLSFEKPNLLLDAGNGNGFKMGGSNVFGAHKLDNSISYENKAKGIDSNSGPNIKISNSTSYNNGSYNVALYTSDKTLKTDFSAKGILSFRKGTNIGEQISLQSQNSSDVMDNTNFYWNKEENISKNTASKVLTVDENDFINLDTEVEPKRSEDGRIDMNGLLLLKPEAKDRLSSGAGGKEFGEIISDKPDKNIDVAKEESGSALPSTDKKDDKQDNKLFDTEYTKVSDDNNQSPSNESKVIIPNDSKSNGNGGRSGSQKRRSSYTGGVITRIHHGIFTGWKMEILNGAIVWKYVENGKSVTSQWAYIFNPYTGRNAWFRFDKNGVMETGWINENGINYYLSEISDGSLGEWIKK